MKLCKPVLLLVFFVFCYSVGYGSPDYDSPPAGHLKELQGIEDLINQALKDNCLPGAAVAVVAGGRVVYAQGFGFRDLEARKPMTPDTLFPVGSTTKAMTATVLGMLVDEGRLKWDKPLRDYLPTFRLKDPVVSERITLRDLLTHRSGLPGHDLVWLNNNDITRAELVARLAYLEPNCDLCERWQYNSLMYMTAGYLAGQVSGGSWEEVMQKRLFGPLGMVRSSFSVTDSQRDDDFAYPYRSNGRSAERIPFRRLAVIGPAGSVNSSVNEMARWLLFNLSGGKTGDRQLIAPATLAEIQSPQMVTGKRLRRGVLQSVYGMGWNVEVYRGHRRVEHGGGIDGFSTSAMLFPDDDLGIVSFDDGEYGNLAISELINNCIADRMLGLEPIDWLEHDKKDAEQQSSSEQHKQDIEERDGRQDEERAADTKPSHPLAAYAAEYHNPGYGTLTITLATADLDVKYNGIVVPLSHWRYDVWKGTATRDTASSFFEDMKFVFRSDTEGRISSVEAAFEGSVSPIIFEKGPAR